MIHRKVLNAKGCTNDRLRAIFTAEEGADKKIQKRFQDRIMSRVTDGIRQCAKNAAMWQAVDIAWDSTPIQTETIPLLLWAQKKIDNKSLIDCLNQTEVGKQCIKKVGDEIKIDMPRLYEMSLNLIRAYVTRRLASQTTRFSNLWPYFKYEPRGVDLVAKLRADALSERVDVMANQYNYRHFFPQTFRHQFLYGRSVVFLRSAWDKKISWKAKDLNLPSDQIEIESFVERQGLDFVAPHPSRVFWDTASALANINTDTGPAYIGYWDIIPYRSIKDGDYYNRDKVWASSSNTELLSQFGTFFNYYFDPAVLKWPEVRHDPSSGNDRLRNIGTYNAEEGDKGCLTAQYFERINPKAEGIADLNVDVWVRLAVAGDNTVIGGEFLTSTPAAYGGLNENDDRLVSPSMATELMGYQDQMTNIFSQMLMTIRTSMLQIWTIDQDALDDKMKEHIKTTMQAKDYYTEPQAFFYSGEKLRSLGIQNPADNQRAFLNIIQANVSTKISESLAAVNAILNMADRLLMFSPNEGAQPNPREVAAREITEISTSTDAIKTFVSDGIDEQRAAVKRICYESCVCEDEEEVKVPVLDRYTAKTIRDAGFAPKVGTFEDNEIVPMKTPIIGKVQSLVYDYYFDSRDGGDRAVNSQGAQVIAQLLAQFMQVPMIAQAFGKKRLFEWANEVVRMSGAAIDLKLELDDGEPDQMSAGDPGLEQRIAKIEQFLTKLMQQQSGGQPPEGGGPAPAQPEPPAAPEQAQPAGTPPALMSP